MVRDGRGSQPAIAGRPLAGPPERLTIADYLGQAKGDGSLPPTSPSGEAPKASRSSLAPPRGAVNQEIGPGAESLRRPAEPEAPAPREGRDPLAEVVRLVAERRRRELEDAVRKATASWKNAPAVRLVRSADELPFEAPPDVEGAWHQGTVYLVTDNLRDGEHAARVLVHEAVGHGGVRALLGEHLHRLLDDVWRAYEAGKLRERDARLDLRAIARDYDLDLSRPEGRRLAAEEYLARLAEEGRENSFLQRLLVQVRNWLRKVFPGLRVSRAELVDIVARARGAVERGAARQASGGRGPARPRAEERPAMARPREEGPRPEVEDEIRAVLRGKTLDRPLQVGRTPRVLRALGAPDAPLNVAEGVLWKAVDKHGMTPSEIVAAVRGLYRPVMVFDSATAPDALVAIVEAESRGRPVVAAVHLRRGERALVNRIASIHGKDSPAFVRRWVEEGLLRYVDEERIGPWSMSIGLYLPKEGLRGRGNTRVLRARDVFKRDVGQSGPRLSRPGRGAPPEGPDDPKYRIRREFLSWSASGRLPTGWSVRSTRWRACRGPGSTTWSAATGPWAASRPPTAWRGRSASSCRAARPRTGRRPTGT